MGFTVHGSCSDVRGSLSVFVVKLCTGFFLVLAILHLLGIVSWQQGLTTLGLSYWGVTHRFWLFQFVTAPLLHVRLTHLAFNMLALWMLGPSVEAALGRKRYVVFSILCAAFSMAGFLVWNWGEDTVGLGYSGVIFGLLAAQAILFPERVLYIYAFFPLKMKHAVLLLAAVEFYFLLSPARAGIGHAAHVFGALGGWLYLRAARPPASARSPKSEKPRWRPRFKLRPRRDQQEIPWEL